MSAVYPLHSLLSQLYIIMSLAHGHKPHDDDDDDDDNNDDNNDNDDDDDDDDEHNDDNDDDNDRIHMINLTLSSEMFLGS